MEDGGKPYYIQYLIKLEKLHIMQVISKILQRKKKRNRNLKKEKINYKILVKNMKLSPKMSMLVFIILIFVESFFGEIMRQLKLLECQKKH